SLAGNPASDLPWLTESADCGSLPNRSSVDGEALPASWRSANAVSGPGLPSLAVASLTASSADAPTELRAGSGMPIRRVPPAGGSGPGAGRWARRGGLCGRRGWGAAAAGGATPPGEVAGGVPGAGPPTPRWGGPGASQYEESGSHTSG